MFSKKGLSEFISLCLVSQAEYKYSSTDIKIFLENEYNVKPEVIYPMLRKLHQEEFVDFRWSSSTSSPRKEYKILPKGIKLIDENRCDLKRILKLSAHLEQGGKNE